MKIGAFGVQTRLLRIRFSSSTFFMVFFLVTCFVNVFLSKVSTFLISLVLVCVFVFLWASVRFYFGVSF